MKIAWDEIAVIFIALLGVALAYDWWKSRKASSAPDNTIITPPSAPSTIAAFNDLHHAGAASIE